MATRIPDVEIFTGPGCGYCVAAKKMLDDHAMTYRERDVSDPDVRAEMKARLPRERTIPQIFLDGEHIGGAEDLGLWFARRGRPGA